MKNKIKDLLTPILAVLIALLIGGIIIHYLGEDPIEAYGYLFSGAFSGQREFARTLTEATPMIFTGLSLLIGFKAGLFNIGAQGQVIAGGIAAVTVGAFLNNTLINNFLVVLIVAALAGFLFAGFAGFLKAKFGIHEVITTIMLNYIASAFEQYCLNYPLKAGGVDGPSPQTPPVLEAARLPQIFAETNTHFNIGFIIAVASAILVWFIFKKTVLGYEIKATGHNLTSSENAGINVRKIFLITMGLSGLFAGLAGAERVLGGIGQYTYKSGLMASYGFDGMAIALLGKNNPFGVIIAAILFAALRVGGSEMQFQTDVPNQIIIIIQALIILLIAAENMFKIFFDKTGNMFKKKGGNQ
ncbi:MAG: ABC transporter permease [Fusobacteriaceae bacterium]|nr:ABC transporter permease [Fusobacteriaceae bacterium]MBN2838239.1 ABC transporter permease [Fusobacteriaceae bacterium]